MPLRAVAWLLEAGPCQHVSDGLELEHFVDIDIRDDDDIWDDGDDIDVWIFVDRRGYGDMRVPPLRGQSSRGVRYLGSGLPRG